MNLYRHFFMMLCVRILILTPMLTYNKTNMLFFKFIFFSLLLLKGYRHNGLNQFEVHAYPIVINTKIFLSLFKDCCNYIWHFSEFSVILLILIIFIFLLAFCLFFYMTFNQTKRTSGVPNSKPGILDDVFPTSAYYLE